MKNTLWKHAVPIFLFIFFTAACFPAHSAASESDPYTIKSFSPNAYGSVDVLMTQPAKDMYRVKYALSLMPPVPKMEFFVLSNTTFSLRGQFRAGTKYKVAIAPESGKNEPVVSESGVPYSENLTTFVFPQLPPSIRFAQPGTVVELRSKQLVHFEALNVNSTVIESVTIPPLSALLSLDNIRTRSWEVNNEYLKSLSKSVETAIKGENGWELLSRNISERRDIYDTHGKPGEELTYSIPLSERQEREKGRVLMVRLRSGDGEAKADSGPRSYVVTDLSINVQQSSKAALVWVTSLETGLPVPKAQVFGITADFKIFKAGLTDDNGVVEIKSGEARVLSPKDSDTFINNFKNPFNNFPSAWEFGNGQIETKNLASVAALTEDDYSVALTPLTSNIKVENRGIRYTANVWSSTEMTNAQVFTERGVYRPGDTVHIKVAARTFNNGSITASKDKKLNLYITDSKGMTVHTSVLTTGEFGTAWTDFTLPGSSPLGEYRIQVSGYDNNKDANASFRVEEFRPPRHTARIAFSTSTKKDESIPGRPREATWLKVDVEGVYYAGGPVKNGRVRWQLAYGSSAHTEEGYEDYTFGFEEGNDHDEAPLESGEGFLDANGKLTLEFPVSREVFSGERGLALTATVLDFDARAATVTRTWRHDTNYKVGVSTHSQRISSGDRQRLTAIVLDGKNARVEAGQIEAEVLRSSWTYYRKRNAKGDEYWVSERYWKSMQKSSLNMTDSAALFEFTLDWYGEYMIRFTYRDPKGVATSSSSIYRVDWGDWDNEVQREGVNRYTQLSLAPDRAAYRPGQVAKLRVGSQYKAAAYLYTLEREGIFDCKVLRPGQPLKVLDVKIGEEHVPNVFATLTGTLPRGSFPVYTGRLDDQMPSFMYGAVDLPVTRRESAVNVEIGPERKALEAQPGEEVTIDFAATDSAGKPIRCEMAVAVVDEAVLALTAYRTPNLSGLSKFSAPLSVLTTEMRLLLQPQTQYKAVRNEALTGGSEGDGVPVDTRKRFEPVAYWNPALVTDASGRATIKFRLPDQTTSFRVFVVACDTSTAFGNAERQMKVFKPFYLEPGVPRYFLKGDTFTFNVAAFNRTRENGAMEFSVTPKGGLTVSAEKKAYPIPTDTRSDVAVSGKATAPGKASLLFQGDFAGKKDAILLEAPVRTGNVLTTQAWYGTLRSETKIAPELPAPLKGSVASPDQLIDTKVNLTLSASPLLNMTGGLRYMLRYPYGCIEQTSSGVLPLAALHSLLKKGAVPGIQQEEAHPFLEKGVERILSMQTSDGGFSYWPGERESNPWGTFYAANALVEARAAGITVPESALESLGRYLQRLSLPGEKFEKGSPSSYYLLARLGKSKKGEFAKFQGREKELGREERILAALGAAYSGDLKGGDLEKEALEAVAVKNESYGDYGFYARHRADALALILVDRASPGHQTGAALAAKLLKERAPDGSWRRTSDTGWVLTALGGHFSADNPSDTPVSVTIDWGGKPKTVELPKFGYSMVDIPANEWLKKGSISLTSTDSREILYELGATFPRPDYAEKGHSAGFRLSRRYENADGSRAIRLGDLVKVTLELSAPNGYSQYLALEDPLPAGLIAINTAFATEEALPEDNDADNKSGGDEYSWRRYYNSEEGFYRYIPDRLELREDRVVAFRDFFYGYDNTPIRFVYYARAVCIGDFLAPPAKIEKMYDPEVNAYTQAERLLVEKRQ